MSYIITKVIMWLAWLFLALVTLMAPHYLIGPHSAHNTFAGPFDVFGIGLFTIPILIGGGLRALLSRLRNPWLALLPFFGGIFFGAGL